MNLILGINSEQVEEDVENFYPLFSCTQVDFLAVVNSNVLMKCSTESQLSSFRKVVEKHSIYCCCC